MRRVLLHLGLHKTGTTAAQSFLYENRELIWPHFALLLPYKTRKLGLADAATRHSIYGLSATLDDFRSQIRDYLESRNFGTRRGLIVSEENFSGLRPSRNVELGYAMAPELAACLVGAIRERFSDQEVDITIHLSLRKRERWLRSLWAHDLQKTREVQDFDAFCASLAHLPSLEDTVADIRNKLPSVTVTASWLEDMQVQPFGPGTPFAEFLKLSPEKTNVLVPPTKTNTGQPDNVLAELLSLNRSRLDEAALTRQKALILEGSTTTAVRRT